MSHAIGTIDRSGTIERNGTGGEPARVHARTLYLDGVQARAYLDTWRYAGQRAVSEQHVEFLRGAIERGELAHLQVDLAVLGDRDYLVNGQHRLTALTRVEGLCMETLVVRHRCLTEADVASLYATFDRPRVRSYTELMDAMGLAGDLGITRHDLRFVHQAAPLLLSGFTSGYGVQSLASRSPEVRRRFVEEWREEVLAYIDATAGASSEVRQMLRRVSVVAVALVTLRHQPEKARDFWSAAAREDGLARTAPAATLLRFLRGNKARSHTAWTYARYVAGCWNAHYRGDTLDRPMVKDPSLPILILGTPYARHRRPPGMED